MAETDGQEGQEQEAQSIRCFACGGAEMDEMADLRQLVAPEPLIVFVCRNCGLVMHFAHRSGGPSMDFAEDTP